MAVRLARKTLIAPVGIYQERVWKSIIRSGADKVYLITDSKEEYEITKKVADELASRTKKLLMADPTIVSADLSDIKDIYRTFIYIVEKERVRDPSVEIILDTTAATKKAWHVASNIASAYGCLVSYVPGKKKMSKALIEERYEVEKDDPGGEVEVLLPALSIPTGNPLSDEEIKVLWKLKNKTYGSVIELIEELAKEEQLDKLNDAYEKRILRIVRDLETKRLLIGEKETTRTKRVRLTREGEGIAQGLIEANEALKREGMPLIKSLYE